MKKIITFLILVVLVSIGASCDKESADDQEVVDNKNINQPVEEVIFYKDISAKDALALTKKNLGLIILDVSSRYDDGHLPGAINYYVGDGSLDKAIEDEELGIDKPYLVYCHVDSAAILGAEKLIDAGFETVYRLIGNYSGWVEKGYPIEINMKAVGDYKGSALALSSFYDEQYKHTVMADLPAPAEGKFYEGWLVKDSPKFDFFSTGKLIKSKASAIEGLDVYELLFLQVVDKRDFNEVVITEETEVNGLDGKPESHVLEGEF